MKPCAYHQVCRRRMRDGDFPHPQGCSEFITLACNPDPDLNLTLATSMQYPVLRVAILRWEKGGVRK